MKSVNRPARLNRSLLALLGIVLLAAGGVTAVIHWGKFSGVKPGASVLYTVAAAAVVVGLLCLRWLAAQLATRPKARIWQLEHDLSQGHTELATGVAIAPFAEEVTAYPGVRTVRASLVGTHRDPTLSMVINAAQDANLTAIRARLAAEGLPRLRQALDLTALPATVEFRVPG
jgi:hypothetical protein